MRALCAGDNIDLAVFGQNGSQDSLTGQVEILADSPHLTTLMAVQECPGPCAPRNGDLPVMDCIKPPFERELVLCCVGRALDRVRTRRYLDVVAQDFEEIFESAPFGIFRSTADGRFLEVNETLARMCGFDTPATMVEEVNRRGIAEALYVHPERRPSEVDAAIAGGDWRCFENRYRRRDGSEFTGVLLFREIRGSSLGADHLVGFVEDITERERAHAALERYAETQSVLLREVNHRVQNNLSSILGILRREADAAQFCDQKDCIRLLNDLLGRIQGLSTVHGMLSRSRWQPLELHDLCHRVISEVLRSVRTSRAVRLKVSPSGQMVDSNEAHHLTLVLNELATNAVKHAAAERLTLEIGVGISATPTRVEIVFRDDGDGYPSDILQGVVCPEHVGLELIRGIVSHSLGGSVEFGNDAGAVARIVFAPRKRPGGEEAR